MEATGSTAFIIENNALRAENDRLQRHATNMIGAMNAANDALRAENERLRALLSEVVNYFQGGIMPRDLQDWRERSRAALADQGK